MKRIFAVTKKYANIIYPVLTLGLVLLAWLVAAKIIGKELLLPSPAQTFSEFFRLLGEAVFWKAVGKTLLETLISFLISCIAAMLLAVIAVLIPVLGRLFSPIVTISRAVPTMSIILLALIWFKSGLTPLFVAFLIVFPMLYTGFYSALSNVDKELIDVTRAYKVKKLFVITDLYLPQAAPMFFDSIKNALSLNVKLLIAAEVLAGTKGTIGYMMQTAKLYLETSEILAWTIAAVILSYLLELAVSLIRKIVLRWER